MESERIRPNIRPWREVKAKHDAETFERENPYVGIALLAVQEGEPAEGQVYATIALAFETHQRGRR